MEGCGTQQVVHGLVVHTLVGSQLDTRVPCDVLAQFGLECRRQRQVQVVVVLGLDVVDSVMTLLADHLVGIVQTVPVNLPCLFTTCQIGTGADKVAVTFCRTSLDVIGIPHIVVARRHVLPVVRLRVLAVIAELGALIDRVAAHERRRQLRLVVDVPVPGEEKGGCKVVDDTRVALLAVLVAPVGVVVAVVGQPVHFVGRGTLSGALCGVTPGDERDGVVVAQLFLCSEVVGECIVERSLNIRRTHAGPAVRDVGRISPAVGTQTAVVAVHATQCVVAVGTGY